MEHAKWLRDQGGFELIPLNDNPTDKFYRKRPRDKEWRTKKYSESELLASFRKHKALGARVPAGVCVIDIDVKPGQRGMESLAKLPQSGLFDGSYVVTGTGGFHLFFRLPKGVKQIRSVIRELPGIDFRQAGTQVVTAGSVNKEGKLYEWDETTRDLEMVVIPEMPAELWAFIKEFQGVYLETEVESDAGDAGVGAGDTGESEVEDSRSNPAWTVKEVKLILEGLNVEDFRDHEEWLKVMTAVHEACDGNPLGMEAFYEWSQGDSDAKKRVSREDLARRWKTFNSRASGGITRRYIETLVQEKGIVAQLDFGQDNLTRSGAPTQYKFESKRTREATSVDFIGRDYGLDFDGSRMTDRGVVVVGGTEVVTGERLEDDGIDILPDELLEGPLGAMNKDFGVVDIGGQMKIARQSLDSWGQNSWSFYSKRDFDLLTANYPKIEEQRGSTLTMVPASLKWLEWSGRRQYDKVDFVPGKKVSDDVLNLWTGWLVEPKSVELYSAEGSLADIEGYWLPEECRLFERLVREGLAAGNKDAAEYIMNWLAMSFYKPYEPIGVALAFRGKKGIGKGMFGNIIQAICGRYFWSTASMENVVGKFNGNLKETVFLFLDEAVWAGSHQQARRLQNLITEPTITTESKGLQPLTTRNCLHIILASNDSWIVPASGEDERRYAVFDASDTLKHDHKFWKQLNLEFLPNPYNHPSDSEVILEAKRRLSILFGWFMKRGAWLAHEDWKPNSGIPETEALKEQKVLSRSSLDQWWDEVLDFGEVGGVDLVGLIKEAEQGGYTHIEIWSQKFIDDFLQSEPGSSFSHAPTTRKINLASQIGILLRRHFPSMTKKKKVVSDEDKLEGISFSEAKSQAYVYAISVKELKAFLC